jgi:hypothetical protein
LRHCDRRLAFQDQSDTRQPYRPDAQATSTKLLVETFVDAQKQLSGTPVIKAIAGRSLHELTAGEAPSGIFGCNEQNRRSADGLVMRGAEW